METSDCEWTGKHPDDIKKLISEIRELRRKVSVLANENIQLKKLNTKMVSTIERIYLNHRSGERVIEKAIDRLEEMEARSVKKDDLFKRRKTTYE